MARSFPVRPWLGRLHAERPPSMVGSSHRRSHSSACRRGGRPMSSEEKNPKQKTANLELAIASVEKEFGKGAIMRLKEGQSLHDEIAAVPSGSLGLDIALG